jgi:hypothetical protein
MSRHSRPSPPYRPGVIGVPKMIRVQIRGATENRRKRVGEG